MGARKFTAVERILPILPQEDLCIVEIGSERGEGSTTYLANFAKRHGISFYTVDFDPIQYEAAKQICGDSAFCMKGEDFLQNVFPTLKKTIAFLYLDNFDFIYDHLVGLVDNQIHRYKDLGVSMNNENSKLVHLHQTQLAEPFMHPQGLILCDDTFRRGQEWDGKCAYAVPYLLSKGWHILEFDSGERHHSHGYDLLSRSK
jgi:hypothetical protein